jgi:hypothetical protein
MKLAITIGVIVLLAIGIAIVAFQAVKKCRQAKDLEEKRKRADRP